jgi:Fe-S cluster assembly protein SufD
MTMLARAIADRDISALPSRRDDAWKYSDLRAAVRTIPEPSPRSGGILTPGPFADVEAEHEVVFVNGYCAHDASFEARAGETTSLRLRFVSQAENTAHQAAFALTVAPGASLTLIETYEGFGSAYLSNVSIDIWLAEGAGLERIVVLDEPADAVSVSVAEVELQPHAHFAQTVLASGARLQRHETRVHHPGGGAQVRIDGVYLLGGRRHSDITTIVTHEGVEGVTSQLVKGAVSGQARGVFQGRIVVSEGADQTDARMGHHALLLQDGAEIDAKPELEIYADDVSCAHGNTVGALDEEALFYMRQRGIPEVPARALLMQAFLGEVVDRIEHQAAQDAAHGWLVERLGTLADV